MSKTRLHGFKTQYIAPESHTLILWCFYGTLFSDLVLDSLSLHEKNKLEKKENLVLGRREGA